MSLNDFWIHRDHLKSFVKIITHSFFLYLERVKFTYQEWIWFPNFYLVYLSFISIWIIWRLGLTGASSQTSWLGSKDWFLITLRVIRYHLKNSTSQSVLKFVFISSNRCNFVGQVAMSFLHFFAYTVLLLNKIRF